MTREEIDALADALYLTHPVGSLVSNWKQWEKDVREIAKVCKQLGKDNFSKRGFETIVYYVKL